MKIQFNTILRLLWRHRLFTTLNVFGLAVGISACWIIFRMVNYEFSYDSGLENRDKIYRVVSRFRFDEKQSYNGGVPAPIYQGLRRQTTGLENVVPVFRQYVDAVTVNLPGDRPLTFDDPTDIVGTDSAYFIMLPYRWIAGNRNTAMDAPGNVVLTESRAKKYFPGKKPEEIINQTLTYYSWHDTAIRKVSGIVADLKAPTEFTAREFCCLSGKPYPLNEWTNTNGSDRLYLQLGKASKPENVLNQITAIVEQHQKEFDQKNPDHFKFARWFELLPLKDSHFSTYIQEYDVRKASKPLLLGLVGIGLFLLILACINYINLSVAAMPQRAKEIGVRKTLGGSHGELIGRFLSETMITALFAAVLAFGLGLFGFWMLRDIIPVEVTPFGNFFQAIAFMLLVVIVVTALAGIYPGWLITKVRTIQVFRNFSGFENGGPKINLQRALIVFQFIIALVFITSAVIVGDQLHYALSSDMGFNKDAVVLVEIPWKLSDNKKYEGKQFILADELKQVSGVHAISLGSAPMQEGYSSSQYDFDRDGKEPISRQVFKKRVDTGFIRVYDLKLLAGRNLRPSDTPNELVINETAVHAFGFTSPKDALGKRIGPRDQKMPIVGVINDFHQQNFYKTIDPLALQSEKENLSTFNIKLESRDPAAWQSTLKAVEKKWYEFYPAESFSYTFYDETIEKMYVQERHLSKLINLATAIAIFISCLGLIGLAVLTAFQRTKEIGIRKVLGASVFGIVRLLLKEYVGLIGAAILIATPVAWWAMNKWLQNFAYRIQIQWWMFALAGAAALAIALLTVGFHALRAARANPVKSLRSE
jgi:ABC-type antimicrobial peptide transport system permease subunit